MNFFRARASVAGRLCFLSALLLQPILLSGQEPDAQAPAAQATPITPVTRPCPAPEPKPGRKEKSKQKIVDTTEIALGCLEAKATSIEIQEFFQAFIRDQKWSIGKERVSEDSWTFVRVLDKDELVRSVEVGPFAGRVKWSEGKAFVKVNTIDAKGGYTRVMVSARFEGYGENEDRFAPPRDSWELLSNGALEKKMTSALEAHFQSMH